MGELEKLWNQKYSEPLTEPEKKLLEAAEKGEPAVFGDIEKDDPKDADKWKDDRTIRAKLLQWLCVNSKAREHLTTNGIQVGCAKIEGDIDFNFCTITWPLGLIGCFIENISLIEAKTASLVFTKSRIKSITAASLKADGPVHLMEISTNGQASFQSAEINGDLNCRGATFNNKNGMAFIAQNMIVKKRFWWEIEKVDGVVNFVDAWVWRFVDDFHAPQWPARGSLNIYGFEYDSIRCKDLKVDRLLNWLGLQKSKPFYSQPYDQLAKVLRNTGYDDDARTILIEKHNDMLKNADLSRWAWLWYLVAGNVADYGYRPRRPLIALLVIFIFGAAVFYDANDRNFMRPIKLNIMNIRNASTLPTPPPQYPEFSSLAYSLDTLVPFLDIHQQEYWTPATCKDESQKKECKEGKDFRTRRYLWFHICAGWFFSTLALLSFTGLLKKD